MKLVEDDGQLSEIYTLFTKDHYCDKCGAKVLLKNSSLMLEIMRDAPPEFRNAERHLLPVVREDGIVTCEGSRSRAQYLWGEPRDYRTPNQPYCLKTEKEYRSAYEYLQALLVYAEVHLQHPVPTEKRSNFFYLPVHNAGRAH